MNDSMDNLRKVCNLPPGGILINSGEETIATTDIVILDNEDNVEDVEKTSITEDESVMLQIESDSFDVRGFLLGLKRKNIDDIYDLYCSHALENGFSVRKSTTRTENGSVVEKYFLCSCEGAKKPNTSTSRKVYVTRTGYKAYLRAKINNDGLYEVIEHNLMHNHTLTRREWSHMHRLHRSINCEKGVVIEGMLTSGIRATDSFRYMVYDARGEDCVIQDTGYACGICTKICTNSDKFEHCWSSMISTYHLEDNLWFSRLYLLKEKWCTGLNNDFFSAGILSSQRSESINSAIGFNARKSTSLTEFYDIFKRTVQSWRRNEASDEFQCSRAQPTSFMPLTRLLKHASEVYTLTLFTDFEAEFLKCISLNCELIHSDERLRFYNVKDDGGIIVHNVSFSEVDKFIVCSCKRFETCGLLCCHILRILHMHSIVEIPELYINKRWTKMVKAHLWDKFGSGSEQPDQNTDSISWRNHMMRKYYAFVMKVKDNEEGRKILEEEHNKVVAYVEELLSTVPSVVDTDVSSSSIPTLDLARSTTKGRRKRIKGHLQKNKKKNTGGTSISKEFGSKTPNPRLF